MTPKISVIVPVYKVDQYLTECLNSIVNQTLKDIEIIVVDEGDHGRCRQIIDYFEKIDDRVVAPHLKHGGYGASCNYGIDIAKGKYISIIESDDFIDSTMLEELYNFAEKLEADVVKGPFYLYCTKDDKKELCDFASKIASSVPSNETFSIKEFSSMMSYHPAIWSGIYKREYLDKKNIRFVQAKGGAYVDQSFRVETLINTDRIAWLNKPFYFYRTDNENSTVNNFNLKAMIKRWEELHEKVGSEDWKKYYGSSLIREEFINSIDRLNYYSATKDMLLAIERNWMSTPNEQVIHSDLLSEKEKKMVLSFKANPIQTYKQIKLKNNFKKFFSLLEHRIIWRINANTLSFLSIFGLFACLINKELGLIVFAVIVLSILFKISFKISKKIISMRS